MAQPTLPSDLKDLSIDERLQLIEALWNSITAEQELFGLTDAQKGELDRRLDSLAASPDDGLSWDEVKAKLTPSP